MNSISLTSYTLKQNDYDKLLYALRTKGFRIDRSPEGEIIKDEEKSKFNYAIIFRTQLVLLDNRSEKDRDFRARSSELKELLDEI